MKINYTIQFFDDWHCGSGLAAGADIDTLVIKDKDNLPFVPGKTVKGLIKEAVDDINQFSIEKIDIQKINKAFGYFENADNLDKGDLFFSNAVLPESQRKTITQNNASKFLYRTIASTAIDEDGIAVEHSLRKMEVTVPCTVNGSIIAEKIDDDIEKIICKSFNYIKRLGQNRNRGLGRCKFTFINKED